MQELYSYGLLTTSTLMFGFMFFFKDMFRRNYGSGLKATLVANLGGGIFGLISLLLIKGFSFEISLFALIMAVVSSVNGLLFSYCSLKSLGKINLSLYSIFSMLGGMALPFVSGILFHGEPLTLGKLVCFGIITLALILTAQKGQNQKGSFIYYAGVFVFNGMSGVIAALFSLLPKQFGFATVSSTGYSILKAMVGIGICLILLIFFIGKDKRKINFPCIIGMAGSGILGNVGNWLLLLALVSLPASAQYPFITGGTMIVSTVISLFTDKKPSVKEIIAVLLSFVAIILLISLPEIKLFTIPATLGAK